MLGTTKINLGSAGKDDWLRITNCDKIKISKLALFRTTKEKEQRENKRKAKELTNIKSNYIKIIHIV